MELETAAREHKKTSTEKEVKKVGRDSCDNTMQEDSGVFMGGFKCINATDAVEITWPCASWGSYQQISSEERQTYSDQMKRGRGQIVHAFKTRIMKHDIRTLQPGN